MNQPGGYLEAMSLGMFVQSSIAEFEWDLFAL
jgi:hypothetical protein